MPSYSPLPDDAPVITDDNYIGIALSYDNDGISESGYTHRDFGVMPYGSTPCAVEFPRELIIPRSLWPQLIKQKEQLKSRLSDLCSASNVKWLNQSPSWYCWCYAVVHAMMICNLRDGNPLRQLVPESVAGPIKNFRKKGGWGSQALKFIADHGCADERVWPRENHTQANRRKYYTDEAHVNARGNRITEWWEIRTMDEKASCLLRNWPVPSGYARIGHEMCSIDLVQLGPDKFGSLDMDHYGRNGKYNQKVMAGNQMVGDDMVAPRVVTPNLGIVA